MSPLRNEIKQTQRKDAVPGEPTPTGPSASIAPAAPGVLIRKANRELWALPWAYFLGAQYIPPVKGEEKEIEQIQLTFANQLVTLKGRNLESLMDMNVLFQLGTLRELPEKFLETEEQDPAAAPVIISIEVAVREK